MEMLSLLRLKPTLSYRDLWTKVATDVRDHYKSAHVGTPRLALPAARRLVARIDRISVPAIIGLAHVKRNRRQKTDAGRR